VSLTLTAIATKLDSLAYRDFPTYVYAANSAQGDAYDAAVMHLVEARALVMHAIDGLRDAGIDVDFASGE
jgi:hypothetical protein